MTIFTDCFGTDFTTPAGTAPSPGTRVSLPTGGQGTWMGAVIKDK